ncbi:hypothetical protein Vadar_027089 [Vaccinium darrowii]|uniref:Uncharacterized protein n=1 Tax=Vaccinium darrowii TaxID=229202 RepID=A0ACB7XTH0_9ERIC|nr:hypothetical protein Vadar_027089 [Vaccinium darrowii]
MEITSRLQERENPSPTTSPTSNLTTTTTTTSNGNNNGLLFHSQTQTTPPLTPKPISRSEPNTNNNNPYPTTFVQADATTFKQVVQMLTGSPDTANQASKHPPCPDPPQSRNHIPPIKKQGFKLYERRNNHNLRNGLIISPLVSGSGPNAGFSPRNKEILSPSILNFPGLVLSPVTPLVEYPSGDSSPLVEEDKAIAEKGFYLHPSPRAATGGSEPRLLPLFPVTSPRVSNQSEP